MTGFAQITQAITSSDPTVPLDLVDSNNNTNRLFVPSFGYITSELSRLDTNIKNLSNLGTSTTNIRLSDGSYRQILVSNILTEANDITSLNNVNTFNIKDNYFFDNFINPYLFVTFDITNQAPSNTQQIEVYKFILDL